MEMVSLNFVFECVHLAQKQEKNLPTTKVFRNIYHQYLCQKFSSNNILNVQWFHISDLITYVDDHKFNYYLSFYIWSECT